jgi:hypothetical protein
MKYSPLLAAAALSSCFSLPVAAQAQLIGRGNGNSGYGIFGDGTSLNGVYNGTGYANQFNRNFAYNQNQIGNFAQQTYSGSYVQPLGRFGLGPNGSAGQGNSALSPYLSLLKTGNAAVNYYGLVRPQMRQGGVNGDWATNYKQAEKQGEEELRAQQGLDPNLSQVDWSQGYKQAEFEGEREARRRAGENPEPEFRDWATSYKDQEIQGEAKAEKDRLKSKQRAANLRQARALKELEGDLSGTATDVGKYVAPPTLAMGLQNSRGPLNASQFKSMRHFFPSQGLPISRIAGH